MAADFLWQDVPTPGRLVMRRFGIRYIGRGRNTEYNYMGRLYSWECAFVVSHRTAQERYSCNGFQYEHSYCTPGPDLRYPITLLIYTSSSAVSSPEIKQSRTTTVEYVLIYPIVAFGKTLCPGCHSSTALWERRAACFAREKQKVFID